MCSSKNLLKENYNFLHIPRPGQNLVSEATFRSVFEIEMGSLGKATADTRSKSLVAERIRHFRIIGCFSPTVKKRRRKKDQLPIIFRHLKASHSKHVTSALWCPWVHRSYYITKQGN